MEVLSLYMLKKCTIKSNFVIFYVVFFLLWSVKFVIFACQLNLIGIYHLKSIIFVQWNWPLYTIIICYLIWAEFPLLCEFYKLSLHKKLYFYQQADLSVFYVMNYWKVQSIYSQSSHVVTSITQSPVFYLSFYWKTSWNLF